MCLGHNFMSAVAVIKSNHNQIIVVLPRVISWYFQQIVWLCLMKLFLQALRGVHGLDLPLPNTLNDMSEYIRISENLYRNSVDNVTSLMWIHEWKFGLLLSIVHKMFIYGFITRWLLIQNSLTALLEFLNWNRVGIKHSPSLKTILLSFILPYWGKLWWEENLANHVKYCSSQNKFGVSYHDAHPLCLISFTVLKQQLSSLDAVSFTSCLDC